MSKHLIVFSVDALVFEDLEYARTLPAFGELLQRGSVVERVTTAYPSSTHPVHSVIMSGQPTGDTGIVNTGIFDPLNPEKNKGIFNSLSEVRCDTVLHAAKRAGLTTACSNWPLTSNGNEAIDWLVPNAMNADFIGFESNPLDAYRRLGATESIIDVIEEGIRRYGYKNEHPAIDYFQAYCASEIIKRYKPNLLLTHPGDVDAVRHATGVFNDSVKSSIRKMDECVATVIQATKDAGIYEQTNFIVLGDHGQINITRSVSVNAFLAQAGYIRLNAEGKIESYDAVSFSSGASAHVYLSDKKNQRLKQDVYALLKDMARQGLYGIGEVMTEEQARERYGLYGDFSFVIDTDGCTTFDNKHDFPAARTFDFGNYKALRGTHGYAPEKGPQPTFFAAGPAVKQGVTVERGNALNHAPTMAAILGIELPYAKGKPVTEILR